MKNKNTAEIFTGMHKYQRLQKDEFKESKTPGLFLQKTDLPNEWNRKVSWNYVDYDVDQKLLQSSLGMSHTGS